MELSTTELMVKGISFLEATDPLMERLLYPKENETEHDFLIRVIQEFRHKSGEAMDKARADDIILNNL